DGVRGNPSCATNTPAVRQPPSSVWISRDGTNAPICGEDGNSYVTLVTNRCRRSTLEDAHSACRFFGSCGTISVGVSLKSVALSKAWLQVYAAKSEKARLTRRSARTCRPW